MDPSPSPQNSKHDMNTRTMSIFLYDTLFHNFIFDYLYVVFFGSRGNRADYGYDVENPHRRRNKRKERMRKMQLEIENNIQLSIFDN